MLYGRREVLNDLTTVCQELHQQLEKELRKLCTIMQDLRDAEFVGMHQNTDNLLENISVS